MNYDEMIFVNECFERVKPLLDQGYYINKQKKITRDENKTIHESPWIIHNVDRNKLRCAKWHEMIFNFFGVIPEECMDCYKVVVRPRNVVELFKLSKLQEETKWPCKAGIETRAYTPALYGGYFYTRSLAEGKKRYRQVREMIDKNFDKNMIVYLKRACTEYEVKFGASDKWELDPRAKFYSKWVDTHIDRKIFGSGNDTASFTKLDTQVKWLRFAYEHGDESYKAFTGGRDMYPKPVTYHEEG